MDDEDFSRDLCRRIEGVEGQLGIGLGWRLLYSPISALSQASAAFIGLNPGGRAEDEDHARLAMAEGSAYTHESWKDRPTGRERLQVQVQEVFRLLGQKPEDVLAGNLIPFRTPQASELPDLPAATTFGVGLWLDILNRSPVTTIVTMGRDVEKALGPAVGAYDSRRVPVHWHPITGAVARWRKGRFISLPHLSRFPIMGREKSAAAVQELFADDRG